MRIGIDVSMLVYAGSGVASYTFNLVKGLLQIDNQNQYCLFYSSLRRPKNFYYLDELKQLGAKVYSYRLPPTLLRLLWNRWHLLPVEWLIGKVDIWHSSDYLRPPLLSGTQAVTTLHDLTWQIFPEYHTQDVIIAHQKKMAKTLTYNDMILADSEQTKADFIQHYPQAKNKIILAPLGVDELFFKKWPDKAIGKALEKYAIKPPYLLYVGAIEPRKNIDILIKAFNLVIKKQPELSLVLAGRAGWKNEQVFAAVTRLNLKDKVKFIGFVEDRDLPLVYQGAKLFVYPSSYEGFGLPPLESLAAGTPVVAYNCPSLPGSNKKIINAQVLATNILKQLVNNKVEPIKILNWQQVAQKTLAVYLGIKSSAISKSSISPS
ncbi:glycosyltransferase family 4 protein [Patescibacteria group bacterium]|nr:glycosyltransferase family 4 protein [Patescibacteria group bacterium]MBU1931198.1 glycosyltransferase family 4 protein [Patescibacteria group bacterium]